MSAESYPLPASGMELLETLSRGKETHVPTVCKKDLDVLETVIKDVLSTFQPEYCRDILEGFKASIKGRFEYTDLVLKEMERFLISEDRTILDNCIDERAIRLHKAETNSVVHYFIEYVDRWKTYKELFDRL
jgi:hypothetical protein